MNSSAPRHITFGWIPLLCGLTACAGLDRDAHPSAAATTVRIPFTLTPAHNLSVHATLNATDSLELMFHTGVDSVSLTKDAIAKLSRFDANESIDVQSWGGTTQARRSTGNTLRIGDFAWRDVAITESDNSGTGTDGKFGPSQFGERIIEIDFDARELVIHPTLPEIDARFERLDLVVRHGALFVSGEIGAGDRRCTTEFMLHTGFGGTALLDESFVHAHGLDDELPSMRGTELKDSYGNTVKTRKVVVPSLRLGSLTFRDVPAGLFDGALGSQRVSVLGGALLERCNLILDVAHHHLYLAPSRRFDAPFES